MVCAHSPVCDDKSQYVPINLDRKDTQGYRAHRVTGRTGLQGAQGYRAHAVRPYKSTVYPTTTMRED